MGKIKRFRVLTSIRFQSRSLRTERFNISWFYFLADELTHATAISVILFSVRYDASMIWILFSGGEDWSLSASTNFAMREGVVKSSSQFLAFIKWASVTQFQDWCSRFHTNGMKIFIVRQNSHWNLIGMNSRWRKFIRINLQYRGCS